MDGGNIGFVETDEFAEEFEAILQIGLELSFVDPASQQTFTASGPFRPLRVEPERLTFEARDTLRLRGAIVTLYLTGDEIWALAEFGEHEFLTRIR